ncbi:uncharacterized protein LOC130362843 isoform X2 [Hyla sarda]|uniref:uncharacterized protein LOC130362843 isoform X2 n=1 Tax=Hyla sarda TaxID=327740 RepID=UPI0024C429FA|nr:uncharacterized protein LOC130362843 isoform X2 [Hyla sarda]
MNNCDLEKLSVCGLKLDPSFKPDITRYQARVPSQVTRISVDAWTSDTGASWTVLGGGGSRTVTLKDGLNSVVVEVTAEDGSAKKYILEITKIPAGHASLEGISLSEDLDLAPSFAPDVFEYSCTVPYFHSSISIKPLIQDSQMKVTVNGKDDTKPVPIAVGVTVIEVLVLSADGSNSQVYRIIVTRAQLPFSVKFTDAQEQVKYECPISLAALYRPVSIQGSVPKHTISTQYLDLLTRRSKTDPLDETILIENWRLPEYELDMNMSAANVFCCFAYRGCGDIVLLSDFGNHARSCPYKPQTELDPKTVTDAEWYKEEFSTSKSSEPILKHSIQERSWEKRLQLVHDSDLDNLQIQAKEQIRLYGRNLPNSGDMLSYKDGMFPLDYLHQAAVYYASAVKLKPKDARYHFYLATVLEEQYYASEIYGLRKKTEEGELDVSSAKATGKDEEILAICQLHGYLGRPSIEQQLKALDMEYHQLKEQSQSSRADYIQNLYAWKSKQAGKSSGFSLGEESPVTQAFLKYKDALSLDPNSWQYNFHVGRHLLLRKQNNEALMLLQNSLALRPMSPIARYYVGLALLEQENGPGARVQEAILYLQQGLEDFISKLAAQESSVLLAENLLSPLNAQLLMGFIKFGKVLKSLPVNPSTSFMTPQQVLHFVADWAARAICQCLHRGVVTQDLEWALLEACFGLLEFLVEDASAEEDWVRKRCQALSALIRLTSIPGCKKLLDMQEKVCQLGVMSSPCNSNALYLLGNAQLALYDDKPSSEEAQLAFQNSKLSFKASIRLENMPTKGPPPAELTSQTWWQEWKAAQELKRQKQAPPASAGREVMSAAKSAKEASKGKGVTQVPKVTSSTSRPYPPSKRGGTTTSGGGNSRMVKPGVSSTKTDTTGVSHSKVHTTAGSNTKSVITVAARGRGGAVLSKTATAARLQAANGLGLVKPAQHSAPSHESSATKEEDKQVITEGAASGPVLVNSSSFLPRLGLARALSRTSETLTDAADLYREVIKMAPEVVDAYTELAELLVKTDPLGAVDIYCQYPQKLSQERSFDDAFIPGEIVRLLMKCEKYEDPRLPDNMISYGKIMGIGHEVDPGNDEILQCESGPLQR